MKVIILVRRIFPLNSLSQIIIFEVVAHEEND